MQRELDGQRIDDREIVALTKPDGERYVFLWQTGQRADLLRTFGRFAADPELSFSWEDAAVLAARTH